MSQSSLGFTDDEIEDNDRLPLDAEDRASQSLESPAFQQAKPDSTVADTSEASKALSESTDASGSQQPDESQAADFSTEATPATTEPAPAPAPAAAPQRPARPISQRVGNISDLLPASPYPEGYAPRNEYAAQFAADQQARARQNAMLGQQLARQINTSDPYQNDNGQWVRRAVDPSTGDIHEVDLLASGAGKIDPKTGDISVRTSAGPVVIGRDDKTAAIANIVAQRNLAQSDVDQFKSQMAVNKSQLDSINAQMGVFGSQPDLLQKAADKAANDLLLNPDDSDIKDRLTKAQAALSTWKAANPEYGFLDKQRDQLQENMRAQQGQFAQAQQNLFSAMASEKYVRAMGSMPPENLQPPGQAGDVPVTALWNRAADIAKGSPGMSHYDAMQQAAQEAKAAGTKSVSGVGMDQTISNLQSNRPPAPAPAEGDSALMSFIRPLMSKGFPALGTAGGATAGAAIGGALGIEGGPTAIATGIIGDVAGGIVGSAVAQKLQDAVMGPQWTQDQEKLIAADKQAHPWATTLGEGLPMLLSMLGKPGGSAVDNALKGFVERSAAANGGKLGYVAKMLSSLPGNLITGARIGGADASANAANGTGSLSQIPAETLKGAATMGPIAFVPFAQNKFWGLLGKPAADATVLGVSNALYDHYVNGRPIDPNELMQSTGRNIVPFIVLNALTHGAMHGAVPKDVTDQAQADMSTAVQNATDADAKVNTAVGNGDAAGLAQNLDARDAAQRQAHINSQAMMLGIPDATRQVIARASDPTVDYGAAEERLANDPLNHFSTMSLGESVRDAYVDPDKQAFIAKRAADDGVDPSLAQRYSDQIAGLRAAKDLDTVLTGGPIEATKAQALENAGFLQRTTEPDGSTKMRVTDDAIPMLSPRSQELVAQHGDKLTFTRTAGTPGDGVNAHMQRGMVRMGQTAEMLSQKAPKPDRSFKVRVVSRGENGSGKTIHALDINAPDAATAEQRGRAQIEGNGRMVVTARAQEVKRAPQEATATQGEEPASTTPQTAPAEQPPAAPETETHQDAVASEKQTVTPAQSQPPARSAAEMTGIVRRTFVANRKLFAAVGIGAPEIDENLPSAVAIHGGKLTINPRILESESANLAKHGFDSAEWVNHAVREEFLHGAQIEAERRAGSNWTDTYSKLWNDPDLPDELKAGAAKSYTDFDQLSDAQKGAEAVRMVLDGRWTGRITEAIYRAVQNFLDYIRGLDPEAQKSELLRDAVARAEKVIAEARETAGHDFRTTDESSEAPEAMEGAEESGGNASAPEVSNEEGGGEPQLAAGKTKSQSEDRNRIIHGLIRNGQSRNLPTDAITGAPTHLTGRSVDEPTARAIAERSAGVLAKVRGLVQQANARGEMGAVDGAKAIADGRILPALTPETRTRIVNMISNHPKGWEAHPGSEGVVFGTPDHAYKIYEAIDDDRGTGIGLTGKLSRGSNGRLKMENKVGTFPDVIEKATVLSHLGMPTEIVGVFPETGELLTKQPVADPAKSEARIIAELDKMGGTPVPVSSSSQFGTWMVKVGDEHYLVSDVRDVNVQNNTHGEARPIDIVAHRITPEEFKNFPELAAARQDVRPSEPSLFASKVRPNGDDERMPEDERAASQSGQPSPSGPEARERTKTLIKQLRSKYRLNSRASLNKIEELATPEERAELRYWNSQVERIGNPGSDTDINARYEGYEEENDTPEDSTSEETSNREREISRQWHAAIESLNGRAWSVAPNEQGISEIKVTQTAYRGLGSRYFDVTAFNAEGEELSSRTLRVSDHANLSTLPSAGGVDFNLVESDRNASALLDRFASVMPRRLAREFEIPREAIKEIDAGSATRGKNVNPENRAPSKGALLAASSTAVPDGVLAHAMREAGKELPQEQQDVLEQARAGKNLQEIADKLGISRADVQQRLTEANTAMEKAKGAAVDELTSHIKQVEPAPLYSLNDRVNEVAAMFAKNLKAAKAMVAGLKEGFQFGKEQSAFIDRQKSEMAGALRKLIVQALPVSERAPLADAVTRLVAEPVTLRADGKNEQRLQTLFKRAVGIAGKVYDQAEDLRKKAIVESIQKVAARVADSPSVDVVYQKRIRALANNLDFSKPRASTVSRLQGMKDYVEQQQANLQGHAVPEEVLNNLERLNKLPVHELPTHVLESILGDMALLEKLGRLRVRTMEAIREARQATALRNIETAKTTPLNSTPTKQAQPGEPLSVMDKLRNKMAKAFNYAKAFDRALLPMGAVADALDAGKGTYDGPLTREIHGRIDTARNEELYEADKLLNPMREIIRKNGLTQADGQKLAVYANLQQPGGEERMLSQGVTRETLDKNRTISRPLMEVYNEWQKMKDATFDRVRKVARDEFNQGVEEVPNYFPWARDWEAFTPDQETRVTDAGQEIKYDPKKMLEGMVKDYSPMPRKNVEAGFSKSRVENAQTPISLEGFDLIERHVQDALRFIHSQPVLNDLAKVVNHETFAEKYGDQGQRIYRDYLDTIARGGGIDRAHKWPWLDAVRRNLSLGAIGFRLASNLKHASNLGLAMYHVGPGWYARGMREALSGKANDWIARNMAEVRARHGAESAQQEVETGGKLAGLPSKASKAAQEYAFWIARNVDQINAQATALGGYMRELAAAGKNPDNYLNEPVDRNRVNRALTLMRRAVASAAPKDQPQVLSRGRGLSENVSIAKSVLAFQNVFLDQWSNLRHDFIRAGITERDPGKALAMGAALLATTLIETGIERGSRAAVSAIGSQKEDKKHDESFMDSFRTNCLRRFPFMSQIIGAAKYGGSGIPVVDALVKPTSQAAKAYKAGSSQGRAKAIARGAQSVAELAGVPGSGQVGDVLIKKMPDAPKGHHR